MNGDLAVLGDVLPRFGIDLAAILLLAYALFFCRHRRSDLAAAFVLLNVSVFLTILVITGGDVGLAVGLGLFAILSIVRLRSETFSPTELGYFFIALALALINAIEVSGLELALALDGLALGTVLVVDRRRDQRSGRETLVTLELVFSDHDALRRHLSERLNVEVLDVQVLEIDYVRDTTRVSLRAAERPPLEDVRTTHGDLDAQPEPAHPRA